jgi:hypothetical protein
MDSLQIVGPHTPALTASAITRDHQAVERAQLLASTTTTIARIDTALQRRANRDDELIREAKELISKYGFDAARTMLENQLLGRRNNHEILTRSRSTGLRCGVCGEVFSTDPPCCQFGLDVADGRVR